MFLIHDIHSAGQCADQLLAEELNNKGITPRQFAIMRAIPERGAISNIELVGSTGIDRSTVSDIVRRLDEVGLVTREKTKEDGRMLAVRLTQRGTALLESLSSVDLETGTKLLDAVAHDERDALLRGLAAIVDAFGGPASGRMPERDRRRP